MQRVNLQQLNNQVENIVNDFLKPVQGETGSRSNRRGSTTLRAASVDDEDGAYSHDEEDSEEDYIQQQKFRAQRQQLLQEQLRNQLLQEQQQQNGNQEQGAATGRDGDVANYRRKALEGLNARRLPLEAS